MSRQRHPFFGTVVLRHPDDTATTSITVVSFIVWGADTAEAMQEAYTQAAERHKDALNSGAIVIFIDAHLFEDETIVSLREYLKEIGKDVP